MASTAAPRAASLSELLTWIGRDRVVRNLGWYGAAEGVARVSRIATTVVLARALGPLEMGMAATAITCFELVRVLANNGLGEHVMRVPKARLEATCETVYRLGWILCGVMAALQIAVGAGLVLAGGDHALAGMTVCLAGVFLTMPFGLVQVYLLKRALRLREIALVGCAQLLADNVLTILLALAGAGAWAIVLPKVLTVPIWLVGMRHCQPWGRRRGVTRVPAREVLGFSAPILGSEILAASRLQLDKIIIGAFLGVEALGLYFFAFNAGIGLSLVLTSALASSLFPELARHTGDRAALLARFDRAVLTSVLPISLVILVQAVAAFGYVPLIFGDRWGDVVPLVSLLCLSAVGKPFADAAVQLARAAGLPAADLAASSLLAVGNLAALTASLVAGFSLFQAVAVLSLSTLITQLIGAVALRIFVARHITSGAACASKPDRSLL